MLTLQELKQVVSNREERRKVPSAKYLRENDVAVAKQRLMDCAELSHIRPICCSLLCGGLCNGFSVIYLSRLCV